MEEWQDTQQDLVRQQVHLLFDLQHVAQNIAVREHHPLGIARRPRREDHRGDGVKLTTGQAGQETFKCAHHGQSRHDRAAELVGPAQLALDVFQHDQLAARPDRELVEHTSRRDHVPYPALVDGRIHHALAGRVIQVDRDFALQHQGDVGHRAGDRGGQHHAHVFVGSYVPRQEPAEHESPQQCLPIREVGSGAVGHRRRRPLLAHLVHKCVRQRVPIRGQRREGSKVVSPQ